ncbi:hypothetical protein TWF217_008845 [Orbilia oligospora]|nr:hypothetical protein TWF751_008894 [Orbilia oligospora]KAF3249650.1 hypothetical protein TWF217_008845 [Orbilia oligospora]
MHRTRRRRSPSAFCILGTTDIVPAAGYCFASACAHMVRDCNSMKQRHQIVRLKRLNDTKDRIPMNGIQLTGEVQYGVRLKSKPFASPC